ncbi:MAG: DUF937 domain-containing protein [Emticicia sp.]|nr:DUF937 domain-containing protein [Emticicia sp.]
MVKEQLTSAAISKISSFLGESNENTTSALGSAMPAILGGLMQQAPLQQRSSGVAEYYQNWTTMAVFSEISNALCGGDAYFNSARWNGLLGSIFGGKVGTLANIISGVSGIKSGSASSLLSIAAPDFDGRTWVNKLSSQGMGASGFASLLMSQKDAVKAALPAGIGSVLNVDGLGDFLGNEKSTVANAYEAATEDNKSKSWLPWLLLGGLLLGALFYWKSCRNVETTTVANATTGASCKR